MPLREYALTSNAQQRLCCSIGIEPRTISNNPNALPEIAIDRTSFAIRSSVIPCRLVVAFPRAVVFFREGQGAGRSSTQRGWRGLSGLWFFT